MLKTWLIILCFAAILFAAVCHAAAPIEGSGGDLVEQKKPDDPVCEPGTKTFHFTGRIQKFVAPKGCVVVMSLWGAGGSNSGRAKGGGGGGYVRGAITGEGQTLYVLVGEGAHGDSQKDATQGPFYGGGGKQGWWCGHAGGGGGRTQVSHSAFEDNVDHVLLVAGGGGGAGTCPKSAGGSGGCRDDKWEPHCNGMLCNAEYGVFGKGGYGGRAHNEFFQGHHGGDMGGGGGGGYFGGGAGEGMCDFGTAGGGGSSWYNKEYVYAFDFETAQGPRAGRSLASFGLDVAQGGSHGSEKGGNGLAMFKWYADDAAAKRNKNPHLLQADTQTGSERNARTKK